jgi:branched-chain amino acid transport system ATP-binding protein
VAAPGLAVRGATKRYGEVAVVNDVSLEVQDEILGVIGPNGAGKTTLFGIMSGQITADGGTVHLHGKDVTSVPAHARARMGLARTFQVPRPFRGMSVLENLMVAGLMRERSVVRARARAATLLETVNWRGDPGRTVDELGEIELKRLEVARALALEPRVLLLDEVFAGLTGSESEEMLGVVRDLRSAVPSIVLVEHVMTVVRSLCSRLIVLDAGAVLVEGRVEDVLADQRTVETYLGS